MNDRSRLDGVRFPLVLLVVFLLAAAASASHRTTARTGWSPPARCFGADGVRRALTSPWPVRTCRS